MTTVGIIGSGMIGGTVARLSVAAGIAVSYLTLRPRAGAPAPSNEITAVGEIEAIAESLGEFVEPDELLR